jgi:GTP diphosphokinase / guanosine-3',5'-bis(diphosphate) 3'-diphosphatase
VHRIECKHVKGRPQDWVPLAWSEKVQGDFIAELRVKAHNKRGLLARITAEIANTEASIENVQMPDRAGGDAVEMRFIVAVKSRIHLARVVRRIRRIEWIERVWRA